MFIADGSFTLSATDLAAFLSCRHRTALDMAVAAGARSKPYEQPDPLLEVLWQRGLDHEKRFVDSLRYDSRSIVDLSGIAFPERRARTLQAMRDGAHVIVQGALSDGVWMGYPDILQRVETPSALGAWSYEVADTKLSRETRAGTILQLGLYTEMLVVAQGSRPEKFYVVTPDPVTPRLEYRVDDYSAYFRLVRAHLLATIAQPWEQVVEENYPEPIDHCEVCRWVGTCAKQRRDDDHLSLVAGISRVQRRELESHETDTLTSLARLPLPIAFRPRRGSRKSYEKVREQARLQFESRDRVPPSHELLAVEPGKGLCRLPEPSPGDLFLDLEGDPFAAEGGREYLFGLAYVDGSYRAKWAFTERDERLAFEWVMDEIAAAIRVNPDMRVYHYAPYEPSAFGRMTSRHVTREREFDAMLREGRFVDLYAVVRQGLRAGIERYSIKNLEPLYGFAREVPLPDANKSLRVMELALMTHSTQDVPVDVRNAVEGYNKDDCVSTLRLRNWLEDVRARVVAEGADIPRPALGDGGASKDLDDKALAVQALRTRLLDGVPEERTERTPEQHARWLLAFSLDYHRREDRATWREYFRLCVLPEEDLLDEREAVAELTLLEHVGVVKQSVIDRYAYPAQEMEIDAGDDVRLQNEKSNFGTIVAVDRTQRTIDIKRSLKKAAQHPSAVFAFAHIGAVAMEKALLRIGEGVATGSEKYGAARALLAAHPPVLGDGPFTQVDGETPVDFAIRAGLSLRASVLPIQGPPGSGKTYCGSKMICELVRQGKRVGVTANSHKVIRNLLEAVAREARETSTIIKLAHKSGDDGDVDADVAIITSLPSNEDALAALVSGSADVVGGTAWLWSREEFASTVDVLFVDEAGQMAMANVIAVSQAAGSVVLLGDPQQLEQPRKGSHPDGVGVSALEHVLGGHQTIPDDRGIFLPETWRLSPDITAFTSEVFYENRLSSHPGLEQQRINGVSGLPASGLSVCIVDHDGNRNWSAEEVETVSELVARLTNDGVTWTDRHNVSKPMRGEDILVVAPYNSQVNRLTERLAGTGARVGTVDKFQGQEAPVVIYSMATSRAEDAPRGMEFLYNLNRLNVATSRAKCLAVVVASARLLEPECHTPRQMQLANALCRFRELALTM